MHLPFERKRETQMHKDVDERAGTIIVIPLQPAPAGLGYPGSQEVWEGRPLAARIATFSQV